MIIHRTTLGILRIQLLCMDFTALEALTTSSVFQALLKETRDLLTKAMSTAKEAAPSPMSSMGDEPEIQKLPRTLRPKKDPQEAIPVCISPRNPWFGKLSMEEKGKIDNIESDEEEEEP